MSGDRMEPARAAGAGPPGSAGVSGRWDALGGPTTGQGAERRSMQWVGFFLPPAIFFAHLQVGYLLVPWSCVTGQFGWVHAAGIVATVVAAGGTYVALRVWREAAASAPEEGGGAGSRTRFVGETGTWLGALLVLVLVMQTVAGFVISPCQ